MLTGWDCEPQCGVSVRRAQELGLDERQGSRPERGPRSHSGAPGLIVQEMARTLGRVRGRPDDRGLDQPTHGLDQPTQVLALEPTLVVTGPSKLAGLTFTLTPGEHTLGRGAGSDLRIDDAYLSRRHAAVRCGQGEVIVEDLVS